MKKEAMADEIHQTIKAKLSSLKYSDRFYDWKTCPLLCEKISDLLDLIRIGVKDPDEGVTLIIQFLNGLYKFRKHLTDRKNFLKKYIREKGIPIH